MQRLFLLRGLHRTMYVSTANDSRTVYNRIRGELYVRHTDVIRPSIDVYHGLF